MAIGLDTFRKLIHEGQELLLDVELFNRDYDFEPNGRYVMVGVRQAGKSYMLYKRAKQYFNNGYSPERMVYIDFDDERLLGMQASDFDLILEAFASISTEQPILFFDEIQNIEGWQHFARRLANRKYNVFITGSNAKMLGRDIASTLGARYIEQWVYPYTFREYLGARDIRLSVGWEEKKTRHTVHQELRNYLEWGGFPELLLYQNKRRWLNELYEKIVLGDIVLRNRIKNEMALRLVYKRLAENIGKPVSGNRLTQLVKSVGVSTNTSTVLEYIQHGIDSCLLCPLENFASKFVEKESIKKYYFVDNGLLNILLLDQSNSTSLENLCALYLLQKHGRRVYYYKNGVEVDFYLPDLGYAVQACWSLNDQSTKQREVNALRKLNERHELQRIEIVTFEEEGTIELDNGKKILITPLAKWLLS